MIKDELKSILEQHGLRDCKIAQLEAELKITDELLKEATETIGAVVACCTYNSNDDAKIGIYGIDQKAFTRIDQFITHYNDAVSAGKVSVDVKRELTDAEIEELGAQEAERKEFCPNCEAETPCTHEAELFVCDFDTDNWRPGYALGMFELMKEKLARERQVSDALYLLLVDDPNTKLKADQILIDIYGKCEPSTSDVSTTQDVTTPEPPEVNNG